MALSIRRLTEQEYASIPDLFLLLEPHQDPAQIAERCAEMRQAGWFCIGAFQGGTLQAMAGISLRTHLFSGRVAFVENVVVLDEYRGRGHGRLLMAWIEEFARGRGCRMVTLDAYQKNLPARAFYERLGYDARGVHFVIEL